MVHTAVIELLRCPAAHEESPLVATATRQIERRIVTGLLGCPVCGLEYAIRGGVADFRAGAGADARDARPSPNEEAAVRLAAQLDLSEPARLVALFGEYARFAAALSVVFDAQGVVIGAPLLLERQIAEHASVLRIDATLPLARASMHGAAVDAEYAARLGLDEVRALLRPNGRLVAPADVPLPVGVAQLARDESEWVAERAVDVVELRRSAR
ncbi:MAG: hypothetical protein ACREOG_22525 [Gemmatimonadaceae bacterium]